MLRSIHNNRRLPARNTHQMMATDSYGTNRCQHLASWKQFSFENGTTSTCRVLSTIQDGELSTCQTNILLRSVIYFVPSYSVEFGKKVSERLALIFIVHPWFKNGTAAVAAIGLNSHGLQRKGKANSPRKSPRALRVPRTRKKDHGVKHYHLRAARGADTPEADGK